MTIEKAKPNSSLSPMPEAHRLLAYSRQFTQEEYEQIQYGYIPQQMEDKWFIYFENNKLNFHRSWTGNCIYILEIEQSEGRIYISKAIVNADPKEYKVGNDEKEKCILDYLIDRLILRKYVPTPKGCNPIELWSLLGRAMTETDVDKTDYDDRV